MLDDRYNLQGTTLGRYEVREPIGRGGTCSVYRARDPKLGRDVALKVLPPDRTHGVTFIDKFRQEARAVARLSHPHILKVHDYGEDGEFAYLVTELVVGGTLHSLLGRPLNMREMLKLVSPLADALDYAHGEGVVHSDLKPSNILLDGANRPILGDFGLARLLNTSVYSANETSVLGTPEYMAPEVVLGRPPEPGTDIYALGVLIYEMLLARAPFMAETRVATAMAHVKEALRFPPGSQNTPVLAVPVRKVIAKALAKEPSERYEKASQLVLALARISQANERETQNIPVSRGARASGKLVSFPSGTKGDGEMMNEKQIKVFLVEDHTFVLDALRALVNEEESLWLTGEATSGEEALERLGEVKPQVVVMDITLPGMNGIETTKRIKASWPEMQVLILSGYGEQYLTEAISAGADGYIMKTADTGQVVRAIHEVFSGGSPIDMNLARTLFRRVAESTGS